MSTPENENVENDTSKLGEGIERSRDRRAEEPEEDGDGLYLTSDSKLQSPEEFASDKKRGEQEDVMAVSSDEDHESTSGGVAGTDRAGTAERKDYGEPRLNPGLEEGGGQKTYEDD